MEKHHSCLNTRAVIEYFLENGPHELPALLAGLGPEIEALPNPQEFLMEIHNWVSSPVVIRMFDNARKITGNDRVAFDIGFESATRRKLGYMQRIVMFAHKNPRRTLKRVQAFNDKFNRNKSIEVVEAKGNRAAVRLHWFRDIPGHRDFCLFNQGIYAGLPTIWNLAPAQVAEIKCFFRGDDYCEYRFKWEKKSFWRRILFHFLAPWPLLKSTMAELEWDKELLIWKSAEVHRLNLQLKEKIDQLMRLQEQVLHQRKMEAVGTLAAGMAHNVNNLLMNIMGLTGLIRAGMDPTDPAHEDLQQIEQEILKGSTLAKQLLSFDRGAKPAPRPLQVNSLAEKTARLFARTRPGVQLHLDLAPRLPLVAADSLQLDQVLLNLFVNAWQAMEGQGEITLTTRKAALDENFCRPYELPPGPYVEIMVRDAGPGLDEATAARIFEPFFTTKAPGQGAGLGLSTVYAIIRDHRGIIQVDSSPGRGATFRIYLPVAPIAAAVSKKTGADALPGAVTVLLVEDEEGLRRVGRRILEQLGYQVLVAANGTRALSLLRSHRDRIALVILDLVLPGMGGAEVFARMKELVPHLKVLVTSGGSLDDAVRRLLEAGAHGFIEKPYRIEALSQKISQILGMQLAPFPPGGGRGLEKPWRH